MIRTLVFLICICHVMSIIQWRRAFSSTYSSQQVCHQFSLLYMFSEDHTQTQQSVALQNEMPAIDEEIISEKPSYSHCRSIGDVIVVKKRNVENRLPISLFKQISMCLCKQRRKPSPPALSFSCTNPPVLYYLINHAQWNDLKFS